ncbi:MAG: hypothetical protein AAFV72_01045 [Cyanobacteria bacterium J06635_1]
MNPSYRSDSAHNPANPPVSPMPATPEVPNSYSPSVPMSVYRELAAELQATKAMAESINGQNQHLARQNQLLRQEIYRVVQTTLQLGQYAGVAQPADVEVTLPTDLPSVETETPVPEMLRPEPLRTENRRTDGPRGIANGAAASTARRVPRPIAKQPKGSPDERSNRASGKIIPQALAIVPKFFTEQSGEKQPYELDADRAKEVSGLWLVVSVILIILTAFGAGFLIMRPLLNSDR